jgi:hypothetical protein
LTLHLLAMNLASFGPIVCIWLRQRGRSGDDAAEASGQRLARWSVAALAIGIASGALLVVFAWFATNKSYFEALRRFDPTDIMTVMGELLASLICLVVYAATWTKRRERPLLHGCWAGLASATLLYHFPPLMIALRDHSQNAVMLPGQVITRQSLQPHFFRAEILSEWIHFILAAAAVTGVALMVIASRDRLYPKVTNERYLGQCDSLVRAGARMALAASLCQIFIGGWLLFVLPVDIQSNLLGTDWRATALFVVAIGATLGLLHQLGMAAVEQADAGLVSRCSALLFTIVLSMSGVLSIAHNA